MAARKSWAKNMDENKDLEKVAREVLNDFRMDAGDQAWNRMDAELNKKQAVLYKQNANRFKMLSAILALFLCSFITCHYLINSRIDTSPPVVNVETKSIEESNVISPNTESDNDGPGRPDQNMAVLKGTNIEDMPFDHTVHSTGPEYVSPGYRAPQNIIEEIKYKFEVSEELAASGANSTDAIAGNPKLKESMIPIINFDWSDSTGNDLAAFAENDQSIVEVDGIDNIISVDTAVRASSGIEEEKVSLFKPAGMEKRPFSISLYFAPALSFHHLKDNTADNFDDAGMYIQREKEMTSLFTGALLHYDLSSRWSVATGAAYSLSKYSITLPVMYAAYNESKELHFMYPTASGVIEMPVEKQQQLHEGDSLEMSTVSEQSLKYLEVPILLQFQTSKNKFRLYAKGGIAMNFLLQSKAKMTINDSVITVINHIDGLRKINYSVLIGAGIEYKIQERHGIFLEPFFKGAITSINSGMAVSSYPVAVGIRVGTIFNF
ncbi:MAG TPA: outer membrane beta-barrel protein [Chitinophagales bacterium]|nr:outer membrane beta-barrel protein [Chitinophagales bacterium]